MNKTDIILKEATRSMGFLPNSLKKMAVKPNILGAFSMLFANIKGFSSSETSAWLGLKIAFRNLIWTIQAKKAKSTEVPAYLKDLIAMVSSNAAGCRYCQAHTAHTAHKNGVEIEKIKQVWEFRTSTLFAENEKAALEFALAAGSVPNQVTPDHHEALKKHFTEPQIVEIMSTIAIFGFLNRWNDSMGTVLEQEPLQFAQQHLSASWEAGKHA
ncbi:MAG: carboxymuconolactone decarboxylase family protein [Bacteroidota bacterium]